MNAKAKRKPAKEAKAATRKAEAAHSVAIVGGGISGLTAALKLLKAGFDVTIFEAKDRLGGNTSSTNVNGVEHDVYPHMFPEWYDNFWDLFENDLGLSRSAHFDARPGVKMFSEGASHYDELFNPTTLDAIVKNLKSGAMSPAEMFLLGYSAVDLAGYPFNREGYDQLDKLSVNGFLYSQSTSTEKVAEMENYMLQVIWSIQSEQTSAVTYQDFIRHGLLFPNGAPFAHMLKHSLQDGLIAPLEGLLRKLGAKIETSTPVQAVRLVNDKPVLHWKKDAAKARMQSREFEQVIIAVPAEPLTDFVMGGESNFPGDFIIDREESLADVRRLRSVPIPVVDLYLTKKLPDFPKENIGLTNAKYGLSAVDISQLWTGQDFGGKTALVIAASDGESLPGHDFEAQAWHMLKELTRFYPDINIGKKWGNPKSDVDWDKTYARSNKEYSLFLNDVGSWDWMPATAYPDTLPGIVFAGDLARGNVDMATVEGAVESGILAAAAVQKSDANLNKGTLLGQPITLVKHVTYGDTALRAAKIALMPFAYAAKGMTLLQGKGGYQTKDSDLSGLGNALQSGHLPLLPLQYTVDWWTTVYWFWDSVFSKDESDEPDGPSNHSDDQFIDLGAAILMVLGEFASYAGERSHQLKQQASGAEAASSDPLTAAAFLATSAGQSAAKWFKDRTNQTPPTNEPNKRRWRPKR